MNTNEKYNGIFTALLTPFNEAGEVNEGELIKLIKFNLDMGVRGFYVCGSTGESFLLSKEERMKIMEIVKREAEGSTLIAHIGSLDERDACEMARHAKALGYDAISSVAPFYFKFSPAEIKGYYERLADAGELPMLVYHIPALSGVSLSQDSMSAFLRDPRFLGIKYTSNDFFTLERLKAEYPDKLFFNGYDEMLLSGLAMGADGAIGSTYNFMADKFVKIYSLFSEGKLDEARKIQNEANKIITILCKIGVMQAEKEILCQLGFDFGCCRRPFLPVLDADKKLIAEEILPLLTKRP